jgi:hypothetical protein
MDEVNEERGEFNLPLFLLFLDLEDADAVDRNKIWVILESYNVDKPLINTTKRSYIKSVIQIKLTNQSQPFAVNMGLRQGCGFSPVLYNIYMNKIIQLWQQTVPKAIKINNGTALKYIAYAVDLVLTAKLEDHVQISVTALNRILQLYNMKISEDKIKSMSLKGKWQKTINIVINDTKLNRYQVLTI